MGNLPPSPLHSSDSEETYTQKIRWRRLATRVVRRWRRHVRVNKQRKALSSVLKQHPHLRYVAKLTAVMVY